MFTLSLPEETRFGAGCLDELPSLLPRGARVALARGGMSFERTGLRARILTLLEAARAAVVELPPQTREPEPEDVDAAAAQARAAGAEMVLAVGGGSVLDLGKAVAALAAQSAAYPVRDYLEGVGCGRVIEQAPLPCVALPTTAGTGTEATKNAVISSQRDGYKKSLRDRRMIPNLALLDPELTVGLPPHLTAWTGMDAITQLIEAFTTRKAQPVTDALALRGLAAARALPAAFADGQDRGARADMALAAYLSGVCLANAGLGAAHGIAAALGSVAPVPHGLACALALPWVMAANLPVAAERYAAVGEALTGKAAPDAETGARAAIREVWQLMRRLGIPRAAQVPELADVLDDANLPALARRCHGNSLSGNPHALDDDALVVLLRAMRDGEEL